MKFSITIPAYKRKYLREAIESVLAQTYSDYELIIVDDCSPEDIKSLVDTFTDSHIRYYRNKKNCGAENVVDNWNICLSYCTGDYVICMGDDDRILPSCLDEYVSLIKKYQNLNVYHAKTIIIDENGERYKVQESRPVWESAIEMIYNQFNYKRVQFIGDFCFLRSWLVDNGGYEKFPYAFYSDWVTANKAAAYKGIANGQVFMFEYREHKATISSNGLCLGRKLLDASTHIRKWYENYISQYNRTEKDQIYFDCITDVIKKRFDSEYIIQIGRDIVYHRYGVKSLLYWLKKSSTYNLTTKQILHIYFYHLRSRH